MKYRFSETALQAGESVLLGFTEQQLRTQSRKAVNDVLEAVIDAQIAYLAVTPKKHSWPNFDALITVNLPNAIMTPGQTVLGTFSFQNTQQETNSVVALIVDAVIDAQAQRLAPEITRWPNYAKT